MPPTEGHAESTWNEWAEAGVTSIAVNTAVLGGLDAPPKDSPWAMLTATQTPTPIEDDPSKRSSGR